jgi:hypothetical protein
MIGAVAVVGLAAGVLAIANPAPPPAGQFVVHEWGTFSSFSGSDGAALKFHPSNTDLPKFVHHGVSLLKNGFYGSVSLETPVTYFYTDKPMTVDVRARFAAGTFTDWYPQTDLGFVQQDLAWTGVRIRPGDTSPLPSTPGENHYYAAREVDAARLEVVKKQDNKEVVERERFLFYRGVGDPKLPLAVTAGGGGTFSLRANGAAPIAAAVVIEVNAGRVRFTTVEHLAAGKPTTATLPAGFSDGQPVRAELVRHLTSAGLYEKEARAMVKTWESAWLMEEGTRVLYVLPTAWAESALPLTVSPKPDALVRVMVGRHDLMTPERERELDGLIKQVPANPTAAKEALSKLGRFAAPAREQSEKRLKGR